MAASVLDFVVRLLPEDLSGDPDTGIGIQIFIQPGGSVRIPVGMGVGQQQGQKVFRFHHGMLLGLQIGDQRRQCLGLPSRHQKWA